MVNPFIWLLLLCITMLVGSFLFGCIPLSSKLSDAKLRHLTALGVGLLMGTALVVIVPEGVQTLYSATHLKTHDMRPLSDMSTVALPNTNGQHHAYVPPWKDNGEEASLANAYTRQEKQTMQTEPDDNESLEHVAIGISLIAGFSLMFTVDQISSLHNHSRHTEHNTKPLDMAEPLSQDMHNDPSHRTYHSKTSVTRTMTPTIGLIVHAMADGVALGASASQPKLSMVVFIAIMLHKAPSAFALTTVLLAEGLSRADVRRHLLLFSLTAPSGAIISYLLLSLFSPASTSGTGSQLTYWTGILLIFSGGTFLYVAMHALQELQSSVPTSPTTLAHPEKLSRTQVATILGGMLLPILLNMKHGH